MELRFWNDPESGQPHIYRHGVTEDEVRQVILQPGLTLRGDRDSRTIMGPTAAGCCLKIVFVPDADRDSGFVVIAYELRGKPLKGYRRAMRRKKR